MARAFTAWLALLAALPSAVTPARAAPWLQPEGGGVVVMQTTAYTATTQGYDTLGRPDGRGRYTRLELAAPYWEHGLTPVWTVGMQPRLQAAWLDETARSRSNIGIADVSAFARYQVYKGRLDVLSVQALLATPGFQSRNDSPHLAEPNMGMEGRVLYGIGSDLPWGLGTGFASLEVAFRARPGRSADEIRADAAFGIRPFDRWLFMLSSFNNIGLRNNHPGGADYSVAKVQVSAVYEFWRNWSLALGYTHDVAGRRVPLGHGVVAALWYRY